MREDKGIKKNQGAASRARQESPATTLFTGARSTSGAGLPDVETCLFGFLRATLEGLELLLSLGAGQ